MARRETRVVSFFRVGDRLHRTVSMNDGRSYAHNCTLDTFKQVAHALAEAKRPTTLKEVAEQEQLPYTEVNIAIEFLKERGLLETVRRRSLPASRTFFECAMTEFYALQDDLERLR
jgi:site-specific recombinase XerD